LVEGAVPGIERISVEFTHLATLASGWPRRCSLKTLYEGDPATECAAALVGRGNVVSEIAVGDEAPETVSGILRAYASDGRGSQKILAQVTTGEPLPLVYVIPFDVERREKYGYGYTELTVSPRSMRRMLGKCARGHPHCFGPDPYTLEGVYSHIAKFEMSLHRLIRERGARLSFVSGGCTPPPPDVSFDSMRIAVTFLDEAESSGVIGPECQGGAQRPASQASTPAASRSGGNTG
jgi:hypothetical protein